VSEWGARRELKKGEEESRGESRGDRDPSSRLHLAKRIGQNEKLKRQLQPHNEVGSSLVLFLSLIPPSPHFVSIDCVYLSPEDWPCLFTLGD